ncbi:iron-containing alcohol dehydrogenase [Roseovarius salis]|uniref:iron-containing alcohol dehydrogenase n=1 Tax=Roseovarius salis TaxID=3376063 RepID=UPI0037CB3CE3
MVGVDSVDWTFPVPIKYGAGRFAELAETCREAGSERPLIVTDRGTRDLPFVERALAQLTDAGMAPGLFAEVSPNPTDTEAEHGKAAFEAGQHDLIIGLGGGSGLDAAKAISLIAGRETPLWTFDFDHTSPDMAGFVPLVCVPTTAGTGAETESSAMITDTRREIKGCVWHPRQKPVAAILDPELTVGLPRGLTAWTGCDALTHAIEAYCVPMFHPMCDGAALEALRLIGPALPRAVEQPEALDARGAMIVGSCLAGVSFLKGLGLVHAISHMVGAEYDTHHGLTNAVLLPAVLRFNAPEIGPHCRPMSQALGLATTDFDGFYNHVCGVLDALDIPAGLSDLGVTPADPAGLAQKASRDPAALTNPRQASVEQIAAIIREAQDNGR